MAGAPLYMVIILDAYQGGVRDDIILFSISLLSTIACP